MKYLSQRGFSLLEVVIAIAIFAIGMLALASLQGGLTRSSADANLRVMATNIAERTIEDLKAFGRIDVDSSGLIPAYGDILDEAETVTEGGITFARTINVSDYFYVLAQDGFLSQEELAAAGIVLGVAVSDFKLVEVNVSWGGTTGDSAGFQLDGSQNSLSGDDLGTGNVTLSTMISSITTAGSGSVAGQSDGNAFVATVDYTPGQNPDIVSLSLGESKFKESTTPEPKVYRDNLETRFDVITYSQTGDNALFLRREEFVAVGCDCTLHAANADNPGKSPTVWAGDEYTEPESLTKAYGTEIQTVGQSNLCDSCCRDHHDVGGSALYDPSRPSTEYSGGNHMHYSRLGGGWVEAGDGDNYLEACRMVRKDGFFRVGQDFRQEGLNTFPEDYLINPTQVADYSVYLTGEVYVKDDLDTYVPAAIDMGDGYQLHADPPTVDTAPRTAQDDTPATGDLTLGYTYLPTPTTAVFQQLRSRSIYIDNLSSDLRAVISCIEGKTAAQLTADPGVCDQGDVELDKTGSANILELLPFFEIQSTYLNDWQKEKVGGGEFTLTNEVVKTSDADGPAHSRGLVTNLLKEGTDMVHVYANRGVTGLTSSDPISLFNIDYVLPTVTGSWPPGDIEVIANAESPTPVSGRVITGMLSVSAVPGVRAANVRITATNATCNYITTNGLFTCFIPTGTDDVTMRVAGFDKPPKIIYLCSSHQNIGTPAELPVNNPTNPGDPKDVDLTNALPGVPYSLWLALDGCM